MAASLSDVEEEIKNIKTEGNHYFGKKDYATAITHYTKGIEHNIYSPEAKEDNVSLVELRQSLLLNRAKCYFQLKNLKNALIDSSNCIQTRDGTKLSFKAHYTRSEIYLHLNDYKSAIKHCDIILKAPADLAITSLQQRTKKLMRQIKEKSMQNTVRQTKQHRSRRANNIVNAMTLTMAQHRSRIELLQKHMETTEDRNEVALMISSKWWRKWYSLDANKKLNEVDIGILMMDNSDLIIENKENKEEEEEEKEKKGNIINIASPYLKYNLRDNIAHGADKDYMILSFKSYQEMVKMGYKVQPQIWVKKIDSFGSKQYELYKSKFLVHFGADRVVNLLCSRNETIRKLCTEIARHFVIQSSSIRLRYNEDEIILDRSHTLAQHEIANGSAISVEIRLPNGCWPRDEHKQLDKDNSEMANEYVICQSCQRLITHFIDCPRGECDAKYCNNKHLAAHWKYHEAEHRMMECSNDVLQKSHGRWGLCGLQNLGNTCYINSSLQCLSFIAELRCYLTSDDYVDDINRENALGFGGELASAFASFLKKMWFGLNSVVCPTAIRRKIGSLHNEWSSQQQQDAEEFIRWLLDGLHEDLNLIKKKPYYVLADSENRNECEVANEHWTLHLRRNQSVIVDIFQGQYKSTLQCPSSSCNHKSLKFDAFSALTLPIPDKDSQIAVECLVFSSSASCAAPYKLTVNVSAKAVVTQLTANLFEKLAPKYLDSAEEKQELLVCRISHNKFGKYWSSSRPIKKVMHSQHIAYVYQVSSSTIAQRKEANSIQIRMNFRYKPILHSHSSGDSSDDYHAAVDHHNKNGGDRRLYFAHPIVTDMKCAQFTGNAIYKMFIRRFSLICNKNNENKPAYPSCEMYIKQENGEECEILQTSQQIISPTKWTNKQRNVATINVQLSEQEYKLYVDERAALDEKSFDTLSDIKPKNYIDIYDCLKLYTAAEVLDDVVWKCSKCKKEKLQPSKQLHLWRLPQILIIHLKRFLNQQGYFGGVGKKNTLNVIAPVNGLDLTEYVAMPDDIASVIPKYDLFATLNHHGIMEFGHYYCCVRTDKTTQITNYQTTQNDETTWHLFNDEQVHPIKVNQLKQYMKDAYLLFYRRRDNV